MKARATSQVSAGHLTEGVMRIGQLIAAIETSKDSPLTAREVTQLAKDGVRHTTYAIAIGADRADFAELLVAQVALWTTERNPRALAYADSIGEAITAAFAQVA